MKKTFNLEKDVKTAVKDIINEYKAWYFMPVTYGFGKSGVPDIACVFKGYPIFIETKFGNKKPTPLQKAELRKLYDAGAFAFVINEEKIQVVSDLFLCLDMQAVETARWNSLLNLKQYNVFDK